MTYYSKFLEDVVSSTNPPVDPVKDQLWWKLPDQTLYIWDGALWILNRAVLADDPSKAPINSPIFTGNPQAPTPPPGDADTSVATTAFVKNALDADTADWSQVLNKPATYPPTLPITQAGVTNLEADLDLKAPKDNPIFTGNPRAPTPSPGDNDTSIATTAFVTAAAGGVFPGGTVTQYLRGDKSWQTLNKAAVGLGNVDNTADLSKPVSTQQANADALRVLKSGDTMSGALTISPPSTSALLNLLALGSNGAGVILSNDSSSSSVYIESRTNASTRWQMFLGDSVAESGIPGESVGTNFSLRRFRNDGVLLGDVITIARSDGIVNFIAGATSVTPGLGDSSTKVATTAFVTGSIGAKEPVIAPGSTSQYWRGDKSWQVLDKAAVGLANVDNTSDASKPVSGPTQTALNLKANVDNPIFTGRVTTAPSGPSSAGLRLPHGLNPTTPINGDLWSTSTGFYGMVNGVVVGPMGPGVAGPPGDKGDKGDKGDPGPQGAQIMFIGDGPPANPLPGQTWFESDTGNSFIYYNDGNTSQWVPTHIGALPGSSAVASTVYIGDGPPANPVIGQMWWDSNNGNTFVYYDDGNGPAQWVASHVGMPAAGGGGGGSGPGGATTQVQFNDAGAFAGNSTFTFNKTTGQATIDWVSGGYGTGGLKLTSTAVTGGTVVLQPTSGNSLYITNAVGTPMPLALATWGNPFDGSTFTNSAGAWTISAGKLVTPAPVAGSAGFNLAHGTTPTTLANGDLWTTAAGLYARINGATVGPVGAPGGAPTQMQFNDAGAFGGDASLVYDKTTTLMTLRQKTAAPFGTAGLKLVDQGGVNSIVLQCYATNFYATDAAGNPAPLAFSVWRNISDGTAFTASGGNWIISAGKLQPAASIAGNSGFALRHGVAPTAPVNGDMWTTTAGLFARINGATQQVSPGWVQMTQAAYDALTPKDANLLYVIVG